MRTLSVGLLSVFVAGCGAPAFGVAMRPSSFPPGVPLAAHCVEVARSGPAYERALSQAYAQGWRLASVSEYTSSAIPGISAVLCFEREQR